MKYLCLVCYEETSMRTLPEADFEALVEESVALKDELAESGQYLAAEALQSVDTATTVRVRDGRVDVTDGPFAETKEQIGGFLLIEAKDLNEAISIATRLPPIRYGCIEVRPIAPMGCEEALKAKMSRGDTK
ncbi:MAG: dehydrogenase [Armatimonadetes bacterium 55-13]|nr:YciI family protein [Armatimonadota bacterium]OJU63712.1 MAG: dehydrogenase [Armatimonadetes bacterium 55-13]